MNLNIAINTSSRSGSPYPTAGLDVIVYNQTYEDGGTTYYKTSTGVGLDVVGQDTDGEDIVNFAPLLDDRFDKSNATYWGSSLNDWFYYNAEHPYWGKLKDYHYRYFNDQMTSDKNFVFHKMTYTIDGLQLQGIVLIYSTQQSDNSLSKLLNFCNYNTDTDSYENELQIEYQLVYNEFTSKPSVTQAYIQNTLVKTLVDNGVWAKMDTFYFPAIHTNDNGEALVNWKNPGNHDLTIELNGGTMNFTAYKGFQSNDGAYLNTNYNPNTQGVNYTDDNASFGVLSLENLATTGAIIGNRKAGTVLSALITKGTESKFSFFINDSNTSSKGSNTESKGIYIVVRTGIEKRLYKNKTSVYNANTVNSGTPSFDMYLLSYNNQGTVTNPTEETLSFAFFGGVLTKDQVDGISDEVQVAMLANGNGIYPRITELTNETELTNVTELKF